MGKNKDLLELLNTPNHKGEATVDVIKQLKHKRETMERISNMITIQVIKTINQIMNGLFVPQMKKMLENKNLILADIDPETDWINTSYVGLQIYNSEWKYFYIAIEFEVRWLKDPIIGFHRKEEYKREDIACWNTLVEKYSKRQPKNENWIFRSFKPYDWHTQEAIDKIVNGEMVDAFEIEIDNMLKCAKEINEM